MQRLKTPAQFRAVLSGATVSRTLHFALHRSALDAQVTTASNAAPLLFPVPQTWLGAVVPKRWARRAVTRNTIKRQIYAVAQDFSVSLPMAAHVVRLRAGYDREKFTSATSIALRQAVRGELQQLFSGAKS